MVPTLYSSVFKICLCLVVQVWVIQQCLRKIRNIFVVAFVYSSDAHTFARNNRHHFEFDELIACVTFDKWLVKVAVPEENENLLLVERRAIPPTGNCFSPWMVYNQRSGMFLLESFLFLYTQSVNRGKAKI